MPKPSRPVTKKRTQSKQKKQPVWLRVAKYGPFAVLLVLNLLILSHPAHSTAPGHTQTLSQTKLSDVLAYATSMTVSDLLAGTNQQRTGNGVGALNLNGQLNAAAQAKANDMVARDYWAHVTPDGQQPWVFFQNAGYAYQKAGENLAYGFDTSANVITGWMNSPPHRENLLDGGFVDVGFGFANSSNFVGSGPETIVVAEYGKPAGSTPPPSTPAPAAAKPKTTPVSTPSQSQPSTPAPTPETPAPTPEESTTDTTTTDGQPTDTPSTQPAVKSKNISRVQLATAGAAPWSTTATLIGAIGIIGLWLLGHVRNVKRTVLAGERFVIRHVHIDLTILAFSVLVVLLCQSAGVVR